MTTEATAVQTVAQAAAEKVKMEDPEKVLGRYLVLWRKEQKQACKIVAVDKQNKKITYELIAGPEKGRKFQSRYDSSQIVDLYNDDSVILAVLDT